MLEIVVCDDDIADLECAVNMLQIPAHPTTHSAKN